MKFYLEKLYLLFIYITPSKSNWINVFQALDTFEPLFQYVVVCGDITIIGDLNSRTAEQLDCKELEHVRDMDYIPLPED